MDVIKTRWLLWLAGFGVALAVLSITTFGPDPDAAQDSRQDPTDEDRKPVNAGSDKVAQTAAEAEDVAAYWTPERMKNAKPVDPGTPAASPQNTAKLEKPQGKPTTVEPVDTGGKELPKPSAAEAPEPALSGGYAYPFPFTRNAQYASYTAAHFKTMGKVFFTGADGLNYVCSGTATASTNKSTVWTAGHCVSDGKGRFHTNWSFVPAYKNGAAPLGQFTARDLWVLNGWHLNSNFGFDLGAAVVNTSSTSGNLLTAATGGQGIKFNAPAVQHFTDIGYPQETPFNGQTQQVCSASSATQDASIVGDQSPIGIGCDMTGGSSGGSWNVGFKAGSPGTSHPGYINSVNSYKYKSTQPGAMYGPYMGNAALNLYNSAKAG